MLKLKAGYWIHFWVFVFVQSLIFSYHKCNAHKYIHILLVATELLNEEDIGTCGCCSLAEPEPISYASEFRDFLQNNAPLDFETKMARARPFIFASFIAWPAYWIYRGMDWSNRAHLERSLVTYINRVNERGV